MFYNIFRKYIRKLYELASDPFVYVLFVSFSF